MLNGYRIGQYPPSTLKGNPIYVRPPASSRDEGESGHEGLAALHVEAFPVQGET